MPAIVGVPGARPVKPILDQEVTSLLAPLARRKGLALAVSGGADSLALMHLVARWRGQAPDAPRTIAVLTVDHGLRAESAAEAAHVARLAGELGLEHATLRWTGAKPAADLQAAARVARYDLMTEWCHARGLEALVTAHHLEDQAETLLMRLARGSGVDGLAAMASEGTWAGIALLRPLLGLRKARLVATLRQAGVRWLEDPSNRDQRFERVRTRRALAELERLGITAERLALTSRRMARARTALEVATDRFLAARLFVDPAGYCRIDAGRLGAAPEEIGLRALARMLAAVGAAAEPPRLARIEDLQAALAAGTDCARTLAGCRVAARNGVVTVVREAGRRGLPELVLAPGASAVWDRRFRVQAPRALAGPVRVRALTRAGCARVRARLRRPVALPAEVAEGLVAFWRNDEILAVPRLDYHAEGIARAAASDEGRCRADFLNAAVLLPCLAADGP